MIAVCVRICLCLSSFFRLLSSLLPRLLSLVACRSHCPYCSRIMAKLLSGVLPPLHLLVDPRGSFGGARGEKGIQ